MDQNWSSHISGPGKQLDDTFQMIDPYCIFLIDFSLLHAQSRSDVYVTYSLTQTPPHMSRKNDQDLFGFLPLVESFDLGFVFFEVPFLSTG